MGHYALLSFSTNGIPTYLQCAQNVRRCPVKFLEKNIKKEMFHFRLFFFCLCMLALRKYIKIYRKTKQWRVFALHSEQSRRCQTVFKRSLSCKINGLSFSLLCIQRTDWYKVKSSDETKVIKTEWGRMLLVLYHLQLKNYSPLEDLSSARRGYGRG